MKLNFMDWVIINYPNTPDYYSDERLEEYEKYMKQTKANKSKVRR
jgi:hypothetical protein